MNRRLGKARRNPVDAGYVGPIIVARLGGDLCLAVHICDGVNKSDVGPLRFKLRSVRKPLRNRI